MPTFSRRALLAALLLVTGCRSEQVAFTFSAPARPVATMEPAAAVAATPAVIRPAAPRPARPAARPAPTVSARPEPAAHSIPARLHLIRRRPRPETAARPALVRRPAEEGPEHPTLHLILGGLLVVGGVVGGILLGGWLGLGVGAAVVLGGYYFLGLAFGGKHAWLGVFQEFFNM